MITTITIRSFKSIEDVTIELGQLNVFVGANGSGKSNLLEAIGVLSAAADGKVNDQTLLQRGVRPGLPNLYKSAFPSKGKRQSHIFFSGSSDVAHYDVSLNNPLNDPTPAWKFKTELLEQNGIKIASRGPNLKNNPNTERGIAALRTVELAEDDPALSLMRRLAGYVIYSPTTTVLRGVTPESQPQTPLGLSGGRLPEAVQELWAPRRALISWTSRVYAQAIALIDWAKRCDTALATELPLSPSASLSPRVIRFVDRYMKANHNTISGYDASEGALYVLFLAVLAAHDKAPAFCAVDNADHGLNPSLATRLMQSLSTWILERDDQRQMILTGHNPAILDGLPLQDDRIRLFAVDRDNLGRTIVNRIVLDQRLLELANKGWTLSRLWMNKLIGGMPNV